VTGGVTGVVGTVTAGTVTEGTVAGGTVTVGVPGNGGCCALAGSAPITIETAAAAPSHQRRDMLFPFP
jgi:hypothetical protein